MIDFRYHLVSIVAIFLALAVGIVLGTTLLQEPAIETVKRTNELMAKANDGLTADLDALRSKEGGNNEFVTALTQKLVKDELNGERVLIVETPGASTAYREAQHQVLLQAGAAIAGRVVLAESFLDPKSSGVIDGLATQLKPEGMVFAPTATAYDKAGALLAATLMTTDAAQAGTANAATPGVLDGFEAGDLLTIDGEPAKRATLAVLFAPEKPFTGGNAETQAEALLSLAAALDAQGKGTVVTGSAATAAAAGGLVAAVRDDGDAAKRVSTVDTPDIPAGRVVIVYALREQVSGRAGQYGIGPGVSAFTPAPPTATPSPSEAGS
ncbi:copper transporter [Nonomuraea indica]|uniref:Copper transporter n=1 Tax=Nonomuraea indica TaxID=1581193 RepID=A0ABW8A6M6_9ACTN